MERRKEGPKASLRVTPKGMEAIRTFHSELESVLDEGHEYTFRGKLFRGLGEGPTTSGWMDTSSSWPPSWGSNHIWGRST